MTDRLVDLSNNNGGTVDFGKVKSAGVTGVYLKATEGSSFIDATFERRRSAASVHGLHVGAYHFAHTSNPPAIEAAHFCAVVRRLFARELLPALDLETNPGGLEPAALVAWARAFNAHVFATLGHWPLFYSYAAFVEALRADRPIGAGLWLAAYGADDGHDHPVTPPKPWKRIKLHQYTSHGRVPGVDGDVDLSHGTLTGLIVTR